MAARGTTAEAAATAEKTAAEKLQTIEQWAEAKKTDTAVLGGVKAMQHWKNGRSVSEKEYTEAVNAFKNGPADGRKRA